MLDYCFSISPLLYLVIILIGVTASLDFMWASIFDSDKGPGMLWQPVNPGNGFDTLLNRRLEYQPVKTHPRPIVTLPSPIFNLKALTHVSVRQLYNIKDFAFALRGQIYLQALGVFYQYRGNNYCSPQRHSIKT